ncbi:hypothetical protein BCON_0456g00010 [Botryotinia convoluta]|uniref:Uncharacterized protein n=1 Tax=Botryotinia convoluta TaxID=54673 RepID=A0A4Z1HBK8_9HELO|nr:hypothetical protein BCON_0456g00010 [Botryotinia convoluta]
MSLYKRNAGFVATMATEPPNVRLIYNPYFVLTNLIFLGSQQRPAQPAQFSLSSTVSALSSGGVAFIATEGSLSGSDAAPQGEGEEGGRKRRRGERG